MLLTHDEAILCSLVFVFKIASMLVMFRNLLTFSKQRTGKEAVGFYISYFILIVLLGGLGAGLTALVGATSDAFEAGLLTGTIIGVVCCTLLAVLIVWSKKLSDILSLILVPVAGLLAMFGGGLLGLIPVAYLTTRKGKR